MNIAVPPAPEELGELVSERYVALHGRQPAGVFAAPGRVSLLGAHVDVPCLSIALPNAAVVAAGRRPDRRITVTSLQQPEPYVADMDAIDPGAVTGWPASVAAVLCAAQEAGFDVPGLNLVLSNTVPPGAGLSSSTALDCAVGLAVSSLAGMEVDDSVRRRLVELCGPRERELAGAPGGSDQVTSFFGRHGHALLIDGPASLVRQVAWNPAAAGLSLLVIEMRAARPSDDGGHAVRHAQGELAAELLGVGSLREVHDLSLSVDSIADDVVRRRARHVITEIDRVRGTLVALEAGDWGTVGRLFNASHESLAGDFEVSCPALDLACSVARSAGVLGARMTGSAFGGSALALVPTHRVASVAALIAAVFASRCLPIPRFHLAPASDGARVLAGGRQGVDVGAGTR